MSTADSQSNSFALLNRLLRTYLAPHRRKLALAVVLMVVASITTSGKALLIRYIFDEIFASVETAGSADRASLPKWRLVYICVSSLQG